MATYSSDVTDPTPLSAGETVAVDSNATVIITGGAWGAAGAGSITVTYGRLILRNTSTSAGWVLTCTPSGVGAFTVQDQGILEIDGDWISIGTGTGSASLTLNGALTSSATSVVVNEDISALSADGQLLIDSEYMYYSSKNNGTKTFTVVRGKGGTKAVAHLNAAAVKASNADQTATHWESTINDYCPAIWVETAAGSGVYERFLNLAGGYATNNLAWANVGSGKYGKFFTQSGATLTFGDGSTGKCPPPGANIRVPNIILRSGNTKSATGLSIAGTGKRIFDTGTLIDIYTSDSFAKSAYSHVAFGLPVTTVSGIDQLDFIDCAWGNWSGEGANSGCGSYTSVKVLNMTDCSVYNKPASSSQYAINLNGNVIFTADNCEFICMLTASNNNNVGFYSGATSNELYMTDCLCVGAGSYYGRYIKIIDHEIAENVLLNDTNTGSSKRAMAFSGMTDGVINGLYQPAGGSFPGTNGAALYFLSGITLKIYNVDISATENTYVASYASSGYFVNMNFRNWQVQGYKTNLFQQGSSVQHYGQLMSDIICYETGAGTTLAAFKFSNSPIMRKITCSSLPVTTALTVYDSPMWYILDDTTGGTLSINPVAVSVNNPNVTISGSVKFAPSYGRVYMPVEADEVEYVFPYLIYGISSMDTAAYTVANSVICEYAIDTGGGYGSWKELTTGNVSGESVDEETGFYLKIRFRATASNTGNYYTVANIACTTVKTVMYPVQTVTLQLENVVTGSQYWIKKNSTGEILANGTAAASTVNIPDINYAADFGITIRVRKAGYEPFETGGTVTSGGISSWISQVADTAKGTAAASGVSYNYSTKEIAVTSANTVNEVYSHIMETFDDAAQMDDTIPMRADTPTQYTLLNSWVFTSSSIQYLSGGALQDDAGNNIWTRVKTLGSIVAGTTLYIEQDGAVVWTAGSTGHIDMLLQTKSGGSEIDGQNFTVYARLFQQTYDSNSATGGFFTAYLALATQADPELTIASAVLDAYTGVSIEWGSFLEDIGDGDGDKPYSIFIECNNYTLAQIYNWLQYQLLSASDIDAGAGTHIGKITAEFGSYKGGTFIGAIGVWLNNVATADINNYIVHDDNGDPHEAPVPPTSIAVNNIVSGSTVYMYDVTNTTELCNEVVVGTSKSVVYAGGSGNTIIIRVRHKDYVPWKTTGVTTTLGMSATADQVLDGTISSYTASIATDYDVDTGTKIITHVTGSTVYTVREFHSWLNDLFAGTGYMEFDYASVAFTKYNIQLVNAYYFSDDADTQYLKTGSVICHDGDRLYGSVITIGTIGAQDIYIVQNSTKLTSFWGSGPIDVLIKVKDSGVLIDSGKLSIFTRDWGEQFDHTIVTITEGGKNYAAISTGTDANNDTALGTVATYSDITLTEGTANKQIDAADSAADYDVVIDCNGRTLKEVYEYLKYVTRAGSTFTILSDNGEEYYAMDPGYAETKNGPFGSFAGGKFFGAQGVWIENMALADRMNYELIDSAGVTHMPTVVTAYIAVSNIVDGSRIQLYDITADAELANEIVSGTSFNFGYTYWGSDHDIRVRLTMVSGASTAYKWYESQGTATINGMSLRASQEANTIYTTNNVDGSTVTECSVSGTTIRIYVDDPDNTTTAQRIYNWYQYMLFTEDGIRDQDGAYVIGNDSTHYTLDNSMKIINQDTLNPLNITGANIVPQSGPATNIFDLSNGASMCLNFNRVEGFAYSSGSGLSTEEHNTLLAIDNVVDAMSGKVIDIHDTSIGKWVLDRVALTLTHYRADGVTVLKTFNLTEEEGVYVARIPA